MQKAIVVGALILSIGMVLSVTIYCLGNRYQVLPTADGVFAHEVDRVTGDTWYLGRGEKMVNKVPTSHPRLSGNPVRVYPQPEPDQ